MVLNIEDLLAVPSKHKLIIFDFTNNYYASLGLLISRYIKFEMKTGFWKSPGGVDSAQDLEHGFA